MAIKIPFDVIEAMLAEMNEAIYSGALTHEVLQACIGAANKQGWTLMPSSAEVNEGMQWKPEEPRRQFVIVEKSRFLK